MNRLNLKLTCFVIAASILNSSAAQAQFVFDPPVAFPAGFDAYPTSLALGRFNDDALLDVLVSGRNVDGLALVLMGNAESFFDAPIQLSLEAQTDWVIAEKLDGDMHLDLAMALRSGVGKIAVLKGTGEGTFVDRVDYKVGRAPSQIVSADFDGDQDLDLAVLGNLAETVTLLRNDGAGVFTPTNQLNHVGRLGKGSSGAFYFTAVDLDGDEDIDIAVARAAGYVSILKNRGDGIFEKPVEYVAGTATGIATGDLDGDGDVDIVFGDLTLSNPGFVGVLLNQGDGTFGPPTKFPIPGNTMWFVVVVDLNGDGRLDVVVSDALGQRLFLLENQSSNQKLSFGEPQLIAVSGFPRSIFAVDIDDDCDMDLLVASIGSHAMQLLINQTPQEKPCRSASSASPGRVGPKPAVGGSQRKDVAPVLEVLSDLNGDGRIDAVDLAFQLERLQGQRAYSSQRPAVAWRLGGLRACCAAGGFASCSFRKCHLGVNPCAVRTPAVVLWSTRAPVVNWFRVVR